MIGLTSICIYLIIVFFVILWAKNSYNKVVCYENNDSQYVYNSKNKMSLCMAIFISILFVLLNIYCTNNSVGFGGDRINYLYDFQGYRSASVGLDAIFIIVKFFSGDIYTVFYMTTFICSFLLFIAYRNSEDADYHSLAFMLSTNYVFFTFTGLKQCYTCAFAALFFSILVKQRKFSRDISCILLMILAALFHTTGFVLVPIFLYSRLKEKIMNSKYTFLAIIILVGCVVFIQPICLFLARLISNSNLSNVIIQYMGAESSYGMYSNYIAALQGVGYYMLVIIGIFKLRYSIVENKYDDYLLWSILGALLYLLTIASYWMGRFSSVFFFPMSILFTYILRNSIPHNKMIYKVVIIGIELLFTLRSVYLVYSLSGGF